MPKYYTMFAQKIFSPEFGEGNCLLPSTPMFEFRQHRRLSWSVLCAILCLTVTVEHRLVTDRQTDT